MKNRIKVSKPIIFAIFAPVILLIGYFFWFNPGHSQQSSAPHAMPVSEVEVTKISKKDIQLFIELPGRVSAYKIAEVRPQIDGVVKARKFVEGSFVKQGAQLYQIDPTIYQSALESARANYRNLLSKKNRNKDLLKVGGVSKQIFEAIEADFAKAQSDLKNAQANFAYTKVYAPISGYIGKSNITEGTLVSANQAQVLTTITQLDPIYVDMTQSTKDMFKLGDQKEIAVSLITDDANYKNVGELKFSEVFADASTDSVRLRAIFSNKDKKLIPGMFVNVKLHLKPIKALTVPQKAASRKPDGNLGVFVVDENNVVKSRLVKATEAVGDSWVVIDGLKDGEIVVVEGGQKIADGMTVKPVFDNPSANIEEVKKNEKVENKTK